MEKNVWRSSLATSRQAGFRFAAHVLDMLKEIADSEGRSMNMQAQKIIEGAYYDLFGEEAYNAQFTSQGVQPPRVWRASPQRS
jgi:hypothetical protein